MNFDEICKELGLKISKCTDYTGKYYKAAFYSPKFDMRQSLIWSIPHSKFNNEYSVAYFNKGKVAVLVDIEFLGTKRPIVNGIYHNYNRNNTRLKKLISRGIELLNRYEPYVKKNQITKRMGELEKDFV